MIAPYKVTNAAGVAPRVGAWIETLREGDILMVQQFQVAPRVGAWIETLPSRRLGTIRIRRTPCGCVD